MSNTIKKQDKRGGKRKGAGRPRGAKNKRTTALQEAVAEQLKSLPKGQVTAMEYFNNILNSKPPKTDDPVALIEHVKLCFAAAKELMPYQNARLNAVTVEGEELPEHES